MKEWVKLKDREPEHLLEIDVLIRHCNKNLKLEDRIVTGYIGDDNFYFLDGGELSFNWDIIEWRESD